jgi:antitoxin (DNA-binding transcriptional repressor) of toxin-antitoxin stability system
MSVVKISDLKGRLIHCLRRVRRGESVLGTDRAEAIAKIDPAGGAAAARIDETRWLDDLERRGVVRRGTGRLPPGWLARRPKVKADIVKALLEERENGR